MTIAERLEGKGRRQGKIEGKQEVLERQLDQRFGLAERERKVIRSHTGPRGPDAALDTILSAAASKEEALGHLR